MCWFRKHFGTKQVLLSLIERWKNTLDQNIYGGAIPMGLSKAFDTINHDLSQTKLGASGFDTEFLKLIKSYLTNRLPRAKVDTNLFQQLLKITFRSTSRMCTGTTFI